MPPIYYKPEPNFDKTPLDKLESLKVDIKTHPGERYRNMVAIYVPLFYTGIPELLLKLVTILNNIILGQDLYTVPNKFRMTRRIVFREALQIFERKT